MTDRGDEASTSGSSPKALPVPVIPDHELVRLIGKGSYGDVWLARNTLGTYRAVKIVYETSFRHKKPFEREFNGVQKFEPISRQHEGLVDVLHVGRNEAAAYFYCVMELADDVVSGQSINPENYAPRTLARDVANRRRLPVRECLRIGSAIASALDFLHQHNLIHRDVKPSNIIFVNGAPRLADIGLVAEASEARSYVGTEGFIPPEGPGTAQSDIYSLGKVLYEISTGKDRHEYPELPTELGDATESRELLEFNKVVLKACRADPRERYRSAQEMTEDLSALDRGEKVSLRTSSRRRNALTLTAGLLAVTALVALLFWWVNSQPAPIPDGLVAWWRAEGDGEDSAGTNNGSLYGVGFTAGKTGRAFDFIAQWHRVYIPDSDDFKLTNALTIEGWINVRKGGGLIFHRGDGRGGLDPYWINATGDKQVDFGICESLDRIERISAPITNYHWQHVAGTFDAPRREMKLYVDGVLVVQTNTTVRPMRDLDPSQDPAIGIGNLGSRDHSLGFDGMVDEIALYSRALSAAEIKRIYTAGRNGKRPPTSPRLVPSVPQKQSVPASAAPMPRGLIGLWRGEEDATDAAGNSHGILRNGVTFAPGKVGKAFKLSGKSFVEIPKAKCFDLTNQVTIEFWMKADLDNPMNVCCQGLVTSDFYSVEISSKSDTVGVNFCIAREDGENSVNTCDANDKDGAVISSGEWHHISATCDGVKLQLYVDGQPWKKPTLYNEPIPRMLPRSFLAIGSEDGRTVCTNWCTGRYFHGLIDEVSIYDRALTPDEIAAIYKAGEAGKGK
jgi:hypothetical protein